MSDIHIDDFFRDAAKILAALYSYFPRKTTLYVVDISGPDSPDEFGLHSSRHQACFDAMLWLASTDYLQFEQVVYQEAIDQVVLSHRGFLMLNSVLPSTTEIDQSLPEAIQKEEALAIHRIRHELKHGTSFSLAEIMRQLMAKSRSLGEHIRMV